MADAELKLLAALPADWQDEARRVSSRFHLDPRGWFQPAETVEALRQVADAVWSERQIAVTYESWTKVTERVLEPLGLVLKSGLWYMVAQHDGQPRTYRLEAIRALAVTDVTFVRPKDFDLAAYWAESTAQFEKDVYIGTAEVRASERGVKRLKELNTTYRRAIEAVGCGGGSGRLDPGLDPDRRDELDGESLHPHRRRPRGAVAARAARGDGRRRTADGCALRVISGPHPRRSAVATLSDDRQRLSNQPVGRISMPHLDPDRLFDAEPKARAIARALYAGVKDLPLVSPHGHTDPRWYAENEKFPDPAQLLIVPDHYVFRMLYSQGIRLEDLGVPTTDGSKVETDGRTIWRRFAENYYLFRGTPTRMWLDHTFATLFGLDELLTAEERRPLLRHDRASCCSSDAFRPRALFERFNLEVISTTDSAIDRLPWHKMIRDSGLEGQGGPRLPARRGGRSRFRRASPATSTSSARSRGEDTGTWAGYLDAHRNRRALLQGVRRDLVRPRPPDGRDGEPQLRSKPTRCSTRSARGKADAARAASRSARRC